MGIYMTSDDDTARGLIYQIENDPFTNKVIKEEEFYRRYGLPVAQRELELLKRRRKQGRPKVKSTAAKPAENTPFPALGHRPWVSIDG
jgi:hypothetical protein